MNIEDEKKKMIYQINYIKSEQLDKKVKSYIEKVTKDYSDVYVKIRIKDENSATQKFDIKNFKYASQISDLLGVMVVAKNIEEVYQIKEDLQVIFPNSTVEDYIENPKFGYQSIHLNCKIKKEIPLEIQIKTERMKIAQDMVHDAIYKNSNLNPKIKNMLSTIAYDNINRAMNINDYQIHLI